MATDAGQALRPIRAFGRWSRDIFVPDAQRGFELEERDVILGLGAQGYSPRENLREDQGGGRPEAGDRHVILDIDGAEFYLTPQDAHRLGVVLQAYAGPEDSV